MKLTANSTSSFLFGDHESTKNQAPPKKKQYTDEQRRSVRDAVCYAPLQMTNFFVSDPKKILKNSKYFQPQNSGQKECKIRSRKSILLARRNDSSSASEKSQHSLDVTGALTVSYLNNRCPKIREHELWTSLDKRVDNNPSNGLQESHGDQIASGVDYAGDFKCNSEEASKTRSRKTSTEKLQEISIETPIKSPFNDSIETSTRSQNIDLDNRAFLHAAFQMMPNLRYTPERRSLFAKKNTDKNKEQIIFEQDKILKEFSKKNSAARQQQANKVAKKISERCSSTSSSEDQELLNSNNQILKSLQVQKLSSAIKKKKSESHSA